MVKRILLGIGIMALLAGSAVQAQSDDSSRTLDYGETVSGQLSLDDDVHLWTFEAQAREIAVITVRRISGVREFAPQIRLLDAGGAELAASTPITVRDVTIAGVSEIRFEAGFPEDGEYQIEVTAALPDNERQDNPTRYTLTLNWAGERRANTYQPYEPLTEIGLGDFPILELGDLNAAANNPTNINLYNAPRPTPDIERDPRGGDRNLIFLDAGGFRVDVLNNPRAVSNVVQAISFRDDGAGFRVIEAMGGGWFFTDQPTVEITSPTDRVVSIELANGQVITTDFFRIAAIEAREDYVVLRMIDGGRAILTGERFNLLRTRQGANDLNLFCIDSTPLQNECTGRYVITDAAGWDTLAVVPEDGVPLLRVQYGADARLISDDVRVNLLTRDDDPNTVLDETLISEVTIPAIPINFEHSVSLTIDRRGMGDVRLQNGELSVIPLDQRELVESFLDVNTLLIEDRAVQFTRADGTTRLSLPDSTEIETPATLPAASAALPGEPGFQPQGFNNLGADLVQVCPCINETQENRPVNPVNGNFYYPVRDLHIPSHTLTLTLERTYNSGQAGVSPTPAYMLNVAGGYALGQFGAGWRHSYQYELDITYAPLGALTLIMPNGSHYNLRLDSEDRDQDGDALEYRSADLPLWSVTRFGGVTGTWMAARIGGERYWFDRAGRLTHITDALGHALTFSPAPRESVRDETLPSGIVGGLFITEPYGRLLQLYTGADGLIRVARDAANRQITYDYDDDLLSDVQYVNEQQTAQYEYDNAGRLTGFEDRFSPYHPEGLIGYDARGRVEQYSENPSGDQPREFRYEYADGSTTQRTRVAGSERVTTWTIDAAYLITQKTLPLPDFVYQFDYQGGLLIQLRRPDRTNLRFVYTSGGLVQTIRDPRYGGDEAQAYRIEWTREGMPSRVTFPNGGDERYIYDAANPYLLRYRSQRISTSSQTAWQVTGYTYDSWGRVAQITTYDFSAQPAETVDFVGTPLAVDSYLYDDFGYLSSLTRQSADGAQTRTLRFRYNLIGLLIGVVDGRSNEYALSWNLFDQLTRIDAPENYSRLYSYDELGRVTGVRVTDVEDGTGTQGVLTQYTYDELGNIASQTDAMGGVTLYEHDEAGNLRRMVLPQVAGDARDRVYAYEYNALDELTRAVDPAGRETTYAVALEGPPENRVLVRSSTDAAGRVTRYTYDIIGRLIRIQRTDRSTTQSYVFDYNPVGELTRVTDQNELGGRTLELQYDLLGRVTANAIRGINVEDNFQFTYAYDALGNLLGVVDPGQSSVTSEQGTLQGNRITTYSYDVFGNVLTVARGVINFRDPRNPVIANASISGYAYDENGNITAITDADGQTTRYSYDALNRLIAVERPDGGLTTYEYDLRGNLVSVTDPNGVTRSATYDDADHLLTITNQGLETTAQYEYDALGRLIRATDENSIPSTYTYDIVGNLIATARSEAETYYDYDVIGRLTSITDALGHTTSLTYTPFNTIDRIIDAQGNERTYRWRNGVLAQFIDFGGSSYDYNTESDPFGRLTQIRDLNTAQTQPNNTFFQYDPSGYITRVRRGVNDNEAAATSQYAYTAQGWITSYTAPDGQTYTLEYTPAGRLTRVVQLNGAAEDVVTVYEYAEGTDWITRIVRGAGSDAESIEQWDYDANGNIVAYTDPAGGRTEYAYDAGNRVTAMTQAVGTDDERTFRYSYNPLGDLTRVVDPLGGAVAYFYDPLGRLSRAVYNADDDENTVEYRYVYDNVGNLLRVELPAGQVTSMTYDSLNRRTRLTTGGCENAETCSQYSETPSSVWSYTYDSEGNVTQVSDPLGSTTSYEYDAQRRLSRIVYPEQAAVDLAYQVAENGNLIVTVTNAPTQERGVADPAINPREQIIYEFDIVGNLVRVDENAGRSTTRYRYENGLLVERCTPSQVNPSDSCTANTTYDYDIQGRLTRATYSDGTQVTREYDQRGLLTRVESGGDVMTFAYDAHGRLVEATAHGATIEYVYDLMDNVIEREVDGESWVYTYDALYRPVEVAYGDHSVTLTYDPNGWRTALTRSNGVMTAYQYNHNGQVTAVTHLDAEFLPFAPLSYAYTYDAVGNIVRIARQDLWDVIYSYDPAHRIIDERWLDAENSTRYALGIRYDAAGNRVEEIRQDVRTLFLYNDPTQPSNDQNQLYGEIRGYVPEQILLQSGLSIAALLGFVLVLLFALHRRKTHIIRYVPLIVVGVVLGAFALRAAAQDAAPPQIPQTVYSYNADGSVATITYLDVSDPRDPQPLAVLNFEYDGENRLTRVRGEQIDFNARDEEGNPISRTLEEDTRYQYDAFSRLTGWEVGDDQRYQFAYDGAEMINAQDSSGALWRYFTPFPGERLMALSPDGEPLWLLHDALGTPRGATDADGALTDALGAEVLEVNASGELIDPNGIGLPDLGFPQPLLGGQIYDPSLSYYVLGLRTYDPRLGRFLQRDPVRHDTLGNTYTYAYNRPTYLIDPTGTTPQSAYQATGAAALPTTIVPPAAPRPLLPNFPRPPITAGVQADEMVRAVQLAAQTRYHLNETVAAVDPLLRDFYVYTVHPIPQEALALAEMTSQRGMDNFVAGAGWIELPEPSPYHNPAPLAIFDWTAPYIAQAFSRPLTWCDRAEQPIGVLPDPIVPTALDAQQQAEIRLNTQATRIPLMGGIENEIAGLIGFDPHPRLTAPQTTVIMPAPMAEPPVQAITRQLQEREFERALDILPQGVPAP